MKLQMKLSQTFRKVLLYKPHIAIGYIYSELMHLLWDRTIKKSYSQNGEDLALDKLLSKQKNGFYIDVGANDPVRFSNTKRFYDRGWVGINIEPNPEKLDKFNAQRPKDINLNIGIANTEGILKFYQFFPDTVSTFSKIEARESQKRGLKLVKNIEVEVKRLSQIVEAFAQGKDIDFISVDTEGYDLEVIKSADWLTFHPKLVCIESLQRFKNGKNISFQQDKFMGKVGYKKVFDNGSNCIYAR